ncbi:MAG: hypothetical protein ABFD07_20920, partial [Methanobacterium sp.]
MRPQTEVRSTHVLAVQLIRDISTVKCTEPLLTHHLLIGIHQRLFYQHKVFYFSAVTNFKNGE